MIKFSVDQEMIILVVMQVIRFYFVYFMKFDYFSINKSKDDDTIQGDDGDDFITGGTGKYFFK